MRRLPRLPILSLFILALLLCTGQALADIVPKNMKPIYVSALFDNLDEYPDHVFVQRQTMGDEVRHMAVIEPGRGVSRLYKFNRLEILAVPRPLFDAAGGKDGLEHLNLDDPSVLRFEEEERLESGQQLVPAPSSVAGKDVHYRIMLTDTGVTLEKVGEEVFKEHPNYPPINLMLWAFVVTFVVELVVFLLCTRLFIRRGKPGRSGGPGWIRSVVVVLAAQVVTLPALWFLIHNYNLVTDTVILGMEAGVVVVETAIYRFLARLTWKQALLVAAACNVVSYCVGLMA